MRCPHVASEKGTRPTKPHHLVGALDHATDTVYRSFRSGVEYEIEPARQAVASVSDPHEQFALE